MTSASEFTTMAMEFEGTVSAPHFDRTAFKVRRTYATLAADGRSANLKLTPDEQEFKVMMAPEAFAPVPGGWGRQGWTVVTLQAVSQEELRAVLEMAWARAVAKK